jgi:hypothetical protein
MRNVEIITTMTNQILINAQDTTVADAYTSVTYSKSLSQFEAVASITGSSATINITKLTDTAIQGTFTATVVPQVKASDVVITNGIINCTY